MRIAHLYAGNLYGGIEAFLAGLARGGGGAEHRFGLAFEGRLAAELRAAGARVDVVGPVRISRPWTALAARRRLREVLGTESADVAVCHSAWAMAVFGPAARAAGLPLVFALHDAPSGGVAERLARRVVPERAVCNSRWTLERLPRIYPGVPAEAAYLPVAPPEVLDREGARRDVRAETGTPEGDVVVLMASRMEAWKGHDVLLRALGRLRERPGWTAWIAGGAARPQEERHRAAMGALAERMGVARRVRFLGERKDVPRLLAAADLLCQPNRGPEPFGVTFVEALYAGLPAVGSDAGGVREVVDRSVGVLVPPGDDAALAQALGGLMADGDRRAALGAAGPARARTLCDPADAARRWEAAVGRAIPEGG